MMTSKPTEPDGLYLNPSHLPYNSTTPQTLDQQLISELHNKNSTSKNRRTQGENLGKNDAEHGDAELITRLRIKVAVMENDLQHALKERDEAINNNMLITKALSGALGRGDKIKCLHEMEDELANLRQENTVLRQYIGGHKVLRTHDASSLNENHIHTRNGKAQADEFISRNLPDSFSKLFDPSQSYNAHLLPPPNQTTDNTSIPSKVIPIISRALSAEQRASYSDPWEQSFDSNSPTVPNSPIITSETPNRPPPDLEPRTPTKMSTQVITTREVGFPSLDAAMDFDLGNGPTTANDKNNLLSELTSDINEQIGKHMTGITSISELPKPTVLKAGFDPKGSFRGNEYNSENPKTGSYEGQKDLAPFSSYMYGHHVTREYNQFPPGPVRTGLKASSDQVQWSSVWNSREEREDAIDTHRRVAYQERSFPSVFRYGYLYAPGDGDVNCLRTVRIGNISAETELRDVLARVRGGQIVKAILLNTLKLTGGNTVLIEFLNQSSANEYASYTAIHPISFGNNDRLADISVVGTPTYPSFSTLRSMRDLGYTRFLGIGRFPKDHSIPRLERDISCCNQLRAESLIEIYLDEEDTLHMEFNSINAAGSAYGILTSWQPYKRLGIFFERDQCARPIEELELPARPRPPIIPRARYDPAVTPPAVHLIPDQVPGLQRKRLAALTNQAVTIPSFSGKQIKSDTNWADEVNDEIKDQVAGHGVDDEVVNGLVCTVEDPHMADSEPSQFVQGLSPLDDVFDAPTPKINPDEIDLDIADDDTPTPAPTSVPYNLSLPKFEEHATLFPNKPLARNTAEEPNGGTFVRKSRYTRNFPKSASLETDAE